MEVRSTISQKLVLFFIIGSFCNLANTELSKIPDRICTFKDENHIYDLSDLAERTHWLYREPHSKGQGHKTVFLYSICHPIKEFPACGKDNGLCFFEGSNSTYKSGGKFSNETKPTLFEEGHLTLTYTGGDDCNSQNSSGFSSRKSRKYSTQLHLQCPLGDEMESPGPVLMSSSQCLFTFVWVTRSACPKNVKILEDPCLIKFSSTDTLLNLHSLNSETYYTVNNGNTTFEINICGQINNGSCEMENVTICNTNLTKPLAFNINNTLEWKQDTGHLIMTYSEPYNVTIEFQCDREAYIPRIYYSSMSSSQEYVSYGFLIKTLVVCIPKESDCILEDSKLNLYDLRPLYKKQDNWEVLGRLSSIKRVLFHINVCGPINHNSRAKCPGGFIGACKTSISAEGAQNLGYITSNPVVQPDGSIVILYTGGDSCRAGIRSSLSRITLTCSTIENYPVLVEITDSCEYIFEWHTPVACPKNVVMGTDCRVTDPLLGWTFNLNPLRNKSADYSVGFANDKFRVNICGPLLSKCQGVAGSSVCQLGSSEASGGASPGELTFNDGTLVMKFSNGSDCESNGGRTSQILFICNQKEIKKNSLQYLPLPNNPCNHNFIWHTVYACPSFITVECFFSDGNDFYDLSPLSNPSVNEVYITSNNTKRYVLNVCRSVVHSKEDRCPYHAGACLIDTNHVNSTLNLGKVDTPPYMENGNIRLHYVHGDTCNETDSYETIIEFKCSKTSYITYPVLIEDRHCLTIFEWHTIYACPKTNTSPDLEEENCTVKNPVTRYSYDMTKLSTSSSYKVHLTNDSYLLLNICEEVKDSLCSDENVGACVISSVNGSTKSESAGKMNKKIHFQKWSSYLEYEGGDVCPNGRRRSTRISFVCSDNTSLTGPLLIDSDEYSCTIFINWYTDLACERRIKCFASSGDRVVDLTPFVKYFGNYEINDPEKPTIKYYINICKPLNPMVGINCQPGSSACKVEHSILGKNTSSLGHAILNPVLASQDTVGLMYIHGSSCTENEDNFSMSTRITFICNHTAGVGRPVFSRTTHDCQVQFVWRTSLVCASATSEIDVIGQCHIFYQKAKANTDLSPLHNPNGYTVNYGKKTFLVNVCGSVCSNSGVCTTDGENYGLSSSSKLEWKAEGLQLSYYSGDPCQTSLSKRKFSIIFFLCDMRAGYGSPAADIMSDDCTAVFEWRTNVTCLEAIYKPDIIPSEPSTEIPFSITTTVTPSKEDNSEEGSNYENHEAARSSASSILIAVIVMSLATIVVVILLAKSKQGRQLVGQVKTIFTKKGDEILFLDDQHLDFS